MNPLPACPIIEEKLHLETLVSDMNSAMRRLRKAILRCREECPAYQDCPLLVELDGDITAAIQGFWDQWALNQTL